MRNGDFIHKFWWNIQILPKIEILVNGWWVHVKSFSRKKHIFFIKNHEKIIPHLNMRLNHWVPIETNMLFKTLNLTNRCQPGPIRPKLTQFYCEVSCSYISEKDRFLPSKKWEIYGILTCVFSLNPKCGRISGTVWQFSREMSVLRQPTYFVS